MRPLELRYYLSVVAEVESRSLGLRRVVTRGNASNGEGRTEDAVDDSFLSRSSRSSPA
jgi:hypothetical protein